MEVRRTWWMVVFLVVVAAGAPRADAHAKDYLVNEYYYTAKKGEFEISFWNDFNIPHTNNDDANNSKHQIELEYGVSDHLQLAYYEVYAWDREKDWERDEFKIEAKARLAEVGQWPVDIALYTEYANPNGSRDVNSDELENKLILSRDFGPWNVVANFIFEKKLNEGEPWEYEYTAGISYAVSARTRLGLEVKQGLGNSEDFAFDSSQPLYIAPGIYTSLSRHARLLFGPAFGLTKVSDDLQLRSLVEVEF